MNELAFALAGSRERFLETTQLGRSFSIAASAWTGAALTDEDMAYPVAAGSACREMGIPREFAALAFLQGFCAALIGTNMHEIPAGEFFRFMRYSSRGSRFGMAPRGNGANMEALAAAIEARGSKVLRHTQCHRIVLQDGRATGVIAKSADHPETFLAAATVISNTGPARTIELAGGRPQFDAPYLARLDAAPHEAPIFHVSFILDAPLLEGFDGCMVFGNTRNLIYLEIPSLISPSVASSAPEPPSVTW